jgi:REP element-mobilizing transposase RayT
MPRPPRIDFPGALYHVTSRGNGRADILWNDDDRERFVGQLSHHLRLASAQLYAYVLRDNHFHLLVRTPRANLSAFMQRLLTAYALYARYKHRRPGHVFQGRFKAKLVEDDRAMLEAMSASRYAIGGAAFIERTEARVEGRRTGDAREEQYIGSRSRHAAGVNAVMCDGAARLSSNGIDLNVWQGLSSEAEQDPAEIP